VAYPLPIDRRGHESKAILAVHDNSSRSYSSGPGAAAGEEIAHIGVLNAVNAPSSHDALLKGLRELGYVEGKNIVIEYRSADGHLERFPELAAELVRLKVDVIVASGNLAIVALKKATQNIPIVMTAVADPVGAGFVASLARPGGNIPGLTNIAEQLSGKRLELLKEINPKITKVAVFRNPTIPTLREPNKMSLMWQCDLVDE